MQAYFDRHDAELELDTFVTKSHSKADALAGDQERSFPRRRLLDVLSLSALLGVAVVLMLAHIGAAVPAKMPTVEKKKLSKASFVIEIPPMEKPKPKPKPEIQPPKPEVTKRLRSIPDSRLNEVKPVVKQDRRQPSEENEKRSVSRESSQKRAMPAVRTPVIADQMEIQQRNETNETLRYAYVSDMADTIGGFVNVESGTDSRTFPEENVSHHVNLDPYHYRMVSLCLRLCVKSMFTHSGMNRAERRLSNGWLEVDRGEDEHFSCLHEERWIRFDVRSDLISDISNLDFVDIPYGMSDNDINLLLEEVTRRLCRLLGYDVCFEQL